jgi:hypothetical protein
MFAIGLHKSTFPGRAQTMARLRRGDFIQTYFHVLSPQSPS